MTLTDHCNNTVAVFEMGEGVCDENPRRVTEETSVGADHLVEDVRGDVAVDGR